MPIKTQTKGHLMLCLLLVFLPSPVVSTISMQRPVNEASIVEKVQQSNGLMIDSRLIARPKEQSILDYKPRLPRSPAVAHQQSTNTAAAKRDLNYKQLRRARGTRDSLGTIIVRTVNTPNEKKAHPNFLSDRINGLNEHMLFSGARLPSPFAYPGQREQGRAFTMTNFRIKSRKPISPRSFDFQKDLMNRQDNAEKLTDESVQCLMMTQDSDENYALFHRLDEKGTDESLNFDANSVADEDDHQITSEIETTSKYEEEHDSQSSETFEDFKEESRSEDSKYEFGYRVIDHGVGSDFGHEESHRVPGETNGRYHVLLPDGRVQRVEYYADDTGYHADISYDRNVEPQKQ